MWYIVDQMLAGGYARTIHKLENAGFGTFLAEPPCTKSSRIRDHSSPAAYTYTLVSNMTQRHRIFNSPPY